MMNNPTIIKGGTHRDNRGVLTYFNSFNLDAFQRFYAIKTDPTVVRAWQGHRKETKAFVCLDGEFKVGVVKPDDWEVPSDNLIPELYFLSEEDTNILIVPPGYANGLKALEDDSRIVVFSDKTLVESQKDDYRFESDMWMNWSDS